MAVAAQPLMLDGARVSIVVDIDPYPLKMSMVLPDATPEHIEPHRSWLEPLHVKGDDLLLTIQSYLIEVDGKKILVDACAGEHKPRPARPLFNQRSNTGFLERIAALGVKPEEIDIVLCTHLHVDHVGWNTVLRDGRWVPTFPNARYVMGKTELEHWEAEFATGVEVSHGSFRDSVLPVVEAGRADIVADTHEIMRGLKLEPLQGHTPGQVGLAFERGDARALFPGDALHSPLQMACPELSTGFDTDKDQARRTRIELLENAVERGRYLLPAHFRGPCGQKIARNGRGFRFA